MTTATPNSHAGTSRGQLHLTTGSPIFTCNDLKGSIGWYCDILGFSLIEEWKNDDGALMGARLGAGSFEVNLAQDDFAKGRDRKKGVGFRFYCNTEQDVDELAATIKQRGGKLANEPTTMPWGDRLFAVTDPDGFMISIARKAEASVD